MKKGRERVDRHNITTSDETGDSTARSRIIHLHGSEYGRVGEPPLKKIGRCGSDDPADDAGRPKRHYDSEDGCVGEPPLKKIMTCGSDEGAEP